MAAGLLFRGLCKIISFIHDFDQARLIKSLSNAAKIDYSKAKQIIAAFI